jgi:hypothetical protein
MKSIISLWLSVLMLFLIMWNVSCASLLLPSVPPLEGRTLRIATNSASLEYRYLQCLKAWLGLCVKSEWKLDTYDLTDPVVRKQLIDVGFIAKVREKP